MNFSRNDTKVIKGVAICLMLYHHLFAFPDRIAQDLVYFSAFDIGGSSAAYLIGNFGQICVCVFFLLGGYGTYLSCSRSSRLIPTVAQKIRGLYAAYWKVFAIMIPVCVIAGVPGITVDVKTLLFNVTGLKITYCGEWWFFTTYIALMLFYPVLHLPLANTKKPAADVISWLLLAGCVYFLLPGAAGVTGNLMWYIFCKMADYLPVFFMGCLFAKYDLLSALRRKLTNPWLGIAASAAVLLVVFVMRISTGSMYDFLYTPAFVAAAYVMLSYPVFRIPYRILLKIGSESTTIWLVHSMFCYMLCQRLVFIPRFTPIIFAWLLVICYATSAVFGKLYSTLSRLPDMLKAGCSRIRE